MNYTFNNGLLLKFSEDYIFIWVFSNRKTVGKQCKTVRVGHLVQSCHDAVIKCTSDCTILGERNKFLRSRSSIL